MLLVALLVVAPGPAQTSLETEELVRLEPGEKPVEVVLSRDLGSWVAVTTFDATGPGTGGDAEDRLGPSHVRANGRHLGLYRHVPASSVAFGPDGASTAFVSVTWGKKGFGKYRVYRDGQPVGEPGHYSEQVEVGTSLGPWFAPDGSSLVWLGNWKSGQYVVSDGKIKKGGGHDHVIMERPFTATGRLAYVTRDGSSESLVVEHKVVATADRIRFVSPRPPDREDVAVLAWVERSGTQERLVVEGEGGPAWAGVQEVTCSAGGLGWAYVATDAHGRAHVVHGSESHGPWLDAASPAFSPDGLHLAFLARSKEGWHLVIDGRTSPAWKAIDGFVFFDKDRIGMRARSGARHTLVVGDALAGSWVEAGSYERIYRLVPGPSSGLALSVLEAGRARVVVGGQAMGPGGDAVRHCTIVLSPDGTHAAAAVRTQGRDVMVLDGEPLGSWDRIYCPVLMDGSSLSFVALGGAVLERVHAAIP